MNPKYRASSSLGTRLSTTATIIISRRRPKPIIGLTGLIFRRVLPEDSPTVEMWLISSVGHSFYYFSAQVKRGGWSDSDSHILLFTAELLGFDQSIPPFSNATNEHILRGLNYASGGSGILDETGVSYVSTINQSLLWTLACIIWKILKQWNFPCYFQGEVISLREQLRNHEMTISRITKLLGDERALEQHLNSCIYYVGMGNNDYLANYFPKFYSSATQYTPNQFAALLITRYSHQLRVTFIFPAWNFQFHHLI